jgi:hypothetical protein
LQFPGLLALQLPPWGSVPVLAAGFDVLYVHVLTPSVGHPLSVQATLHDFVQLDSPPELPVVEVYPVEQVLHELPATAPPDK